MQHEHFMQQALHLAEQGIGWVEPNPPVGAVIVSSAGSVIGQGYHKRFGGPHAEINALQECSDKCQGAALYVTLEPCSHHGKTPPCADAVVAAGISKVVIGCVDPAPHVAGRGIEKLQNAGIEVVVGICQQQAEDLIAPFRQLMLDKKPWVHAKWAMTLDGKIASRTGHSKWISNEDSRSHVHQLRARMDAIITGRGTLLADDPELTARPTCIRRATRIILAENCECLSLQSRLVNTIDQAPVMMCVRSVSDSAHEAALQDAGVEIFDTQTSKRSAQLAALINECGRRQWTHVMTEAGSQILGALWDADVIDEVHVFISPKIVGGCHATPAMAGTGRSQIPSVASLKNIRTQTFGEDTLIEGRIRR